MAGLEIAVSSCQLHSCCYLAQSLHDMRIGNTAVIVST
jgi:hypothetical protein